MTDPCCPWANPNSSVEPFDYDDAEAILCRSHLAEYAGESMDGLDRMDAGYEADRVNLGLADF